MASSSSAKTSKASSPATPPLPPNPELPSQAKKGFLRRMVPFLLAANVGVGAYVLIRTSMQKSAEEGDKEKKEVPASTITATGSAIAEKSVVQPVPVLPPIPEEEQRQLYKWILEEKRKVKTKDPAEKKKLDEEKALLKELLRAKSLPSL